MQSWISWQSQYFLALSSTQRSIRVIFRSISWIRQEENICKECSEIFEGPHILSAFELFRTLFFFQVQLNLLFMKRWTYGFSKTIFIIKFEIKLVSIIYWTILNLQKKRIKTIANYQYERFPSYLKFCKPRQRLEFENLDKSNE